MMENMELYYTVLMCCCFKGSGAPNLLRILFLVVTGRQGRIETSTGYQH